MRPSLALSSSDDDESDTPLASDLLRTPRANVGATDAPAPKHVSFGSNAPLSTHGRLLPRTPFPSKAAFSPVLDTPLSSQSGWRTPSNGLSHFHETFLSDEEEDDEEEDEEGDGEGTLSDVSSCASAGHRPPERRRRLSVVEVRARDGLLSRLRIAAGLAGDRREEIGLQEDLLRVWSGRGPSRLEETV